MSCITVQGIVDLDAFILISPHEHVFVDIQNQYHVPDKTERRALGEQKVSLENLDELARDPYAVRDNLLLDDYAAAVEEIEKEIEIEIQSGIGRTEVRAGVIGELGTSETIHPDEKKVLTAAARAHNETGADNR
jgi:predicted metal-dependent phosphotriesterase family hydrolase